MSTRDKVLECLERNRGNAISGEELAQQLQVSRTAIWKAIDRLRKEGFSIEAGTNKGYLLPHSSKKISLQGLKPYLDESCLQYIHVLEAVESTNDTLKKMALDGAPDGTVVIANLQHKGRGRRGRSFYSPSDSGIYISILMKPQGIQLQDSLLFTSAAGVAVSKVIRKLSGQEAVIKWVNDIYVDGKKVCGILTEASTDLETGTVEWIILGCGINYTVPQEGYPKNIQNVAGALFQNEEEGNSKNIFVAELVKELLLLRNKIFYPSWIKEYKQYSMILHKKIWLKHDHAIVEVYVEDIGSRGELILRFEDGKKIILQSGEIYLNKPENC